MGFRAKGNKEGKESCRKGGEESSTPASSEIVRNSMQIKQFSSGDPELACAESCGILGTFFFFFLRYMQN